MYQVLYILFTSSHSPMALNSSDNIYASFYWAQTLFKSAYFFFLNQQFITRRAVADRGSDYVASYMQSKLTSKYKRKDKRKQENKETENARETENNYRSYSKAKAFGLSVKNMMKWLNKSLLGFQYPLNLQHSWSICLLVSIGYSLHGQLKFSFGKNLRRYSPIGA